MVPAGAPTLGQIPASPLLVLTWLRSKLMFSFKKKNKHKIKKKREREEGELDNTGPETQAPQTSQAVPLGPCSVVSTPPSSWDPLSPGKCGSEGGEMGATWPILGFVTLILTE